MDEPVNAEPRTTPEDLVDTEEIFDPRITLGVLADAKETFLEVDVVVE
jgi:hypothetical protein